jgi:hypothetical protein
MFANGIRVRSVFTQDLRPGAFSVVPFGTGPGANVYPALRAGLLSAVPFDMLRAGSAGLIAIGPDS